MSAMPTSPTYPVVALPDLSAPASSSMEEPKGKKAPLRDRKAYNNVRNAQKRKAECEEAGVPYTKFIRVATATAQMTEQARKASWPDERAEIKSDMTDVQNASEDRIAKRVIEGFKQVMGLPADIEGMPPAQKKEWHKSQQAVAISGINKANLQQLQQDAAKAQETADKLALAAALKESERTQERARKAQERADKKQAKAKAAPKKAAKKATMKDAKQLTLDESVQPTEFARDVELEATFDDEPPQDPLMAWQPTCKRTKLSHAQELSMVDSDHNAESEMGDPNSENDTCGEEGEVDGLTSSLDHNVRLLQVKQEFHANAFQKLATPAEPIELD